MVYTGPHNLKNRLIGCCEHGDESTGRRKDAEFVEYLCSIYLVSQWVIKVVSLSYACIHLTTKAIFND
jgi:hypothetical protein